MTNKILESKISRLRKKYNDEVAPFLKKELGLTNILACPKLIKVTVNVGTGKIAKQTDVVETAGKTLEKITGQRPVKTLAKKSVASFKVREGSAIGWKATLRGNRMYEFVDKLVNVTLARVRDFRGLDPKRFDRQGNYSIGFKEQIMFPEVSSDSVQLFHGLEVTITTSAKNAKEGLLLLKKLGFPFREN